MPLRPRIAFVIFAVPLTLTAACGRPVARLEVALPAPLVARTGCGSFVVAADGTVAKHRSTWAPTWARGAVSHPGPGIWVGHPQARLAIYRNGRLWWRSHVKHASDEVVVNGKTIAFTIYRHNAGAQPQLWLAHVGGHEFLAAKNEEPIGWTVGGLVTVHGTILRVRGPDATIYRTLGSGRTAIAEPATKTVAYVSRSGDLIRTDGVHSWRLGGGFGANAWLQRVEGGVLDVSNGRRSVFLRGDGKPLGLVAPVDEAAGAMGSVIALPHGRGVVYVVHPRTRGSDAGVNAVFVVRPHARPRRLYVARVPRLSCGEYASVSYSNGQILYVDDEGSLALLDPSGRRPPVDLTGAFAALQPRRRSAWGLSADWAAKWR